jgi:recombinational DNA repair protein (RecF pathway)
MYDHLVSALDRLEAVTDEQIDAEALSVLWQVVGVLGFTPSLDGCARDGRQLPAGAAKFSVADGGFLCATCAATGSGPTLQPEDRAALERLLVDERESRPTLSQRHAAAHRRLLARFVRRHLAEEHELKALSFWEALPWNDM